MLNTTLQNRTDDLSVISYEKTAVEEPCEITLGAFVMEMSDEVEASLKTVIDYYKDNALKPRLDVLGNPLEVCSTLVTKILTTLPETHHAQGKTLANFLIQKIVEFCRARQCGSIHFKFSFERNGQAMEAA